PPLAPSLLSTAPATTEIYTLSLHDALPISLAHLRGDRPDGEGPGGGRVTDSIIDADDAFTVEWDGSHIVIHRRLPALLRGDGARSEEHTSELQSRFDLVCRLLLEKKKKKKQ